MTTALDVLVENLAAARAHANEAEPLVRHALARIEALEEERDKLKASLARYAGVPVPP